MQLSELVKHARTIAEDADAMSAARLMADASIGSLVVVRGEKPVGIVTDRDLALAVIGAESDPATVPVSRVMNTALVTLREGAEMPDAVALCREHGIRRLPVVDGSGALVGIVTADDLVQGVARELGELATALRTELVAGAPPSGGGSTVFGSE